MLSGYAHLLRSEVKTLHTEFGRCSVLVVVLVLGCDGRWNWLGTGFLRSP